MTTNSHYALCFKIHAFSEPTTKSSIKIDLHYQRQRCSPITLVSGNIRFLRIFAGFPRQGRQATVGLSTTAILNVFAGYFFGSFRYIRLSLSSPFPGSKNTWLWVIILNGHFTLNYVFVKFTFEICLFTYTDIAMTYTIIYLVKVRLRCMRAGSTELYV